MYIGPDESQHAPRPITASPTATPYIQPGVSPLRQKKDDDEQDGTAPGGLMVGGGGGGGGGAFSVFHHEREKRGSWLSGSRCHDYGGISPAFDGSSILLPLTMHGELGAGGGHGNTGAGGANGGSAGEPASGSLFGGGGLLSGIFGGGDDDTPVVGEGGGGGGGDTEEGSGDYEGDGCEGGGCAAPTPPPFDDGGGGFGRGGMGWGGEGVGGGVAPAHDSHDLTRCVCLVQQLTWNRSLCAHAFDCAPRPAQGLGPGLMEEHAGPQRFQAACRARPPSTIQMVISVSFGRIRGLFARGLSSSRVSPPGPLSLS